MSKNISYKIVSLVFSVATICFLAVFYTLAWAEPTSTPPGNNVAAPLNVGTGEQTKAGPLKINNSFVAGAIGVGNAEPNVATESIRAEKDICTNAGGGKCLSTASGGGFGSWIARSAGTTYQAATDGFVTVAVTAINIIRIQGYTDSSTNPTTQRINSGDTYPYSSPNTLYNGMMMPVRKNDYWRITTSGTGGSNPSVNVYWLPLGN